MPSRDLQFRIESRPRAATLYVSGRLTSAGAVLALRPCYTLPGDTAELRVDLRSATIDEPAALQSLALLLFRWRGAAPDRRSRIDLPPAARRASPPAVFRVGQRAPGARPHRRSPVDRRQPRGGGVVSSVTVP